MARSSRRAVAQPWSPADCCLQQLLSAVWQARQNLLTYGTGIDQTSKLENLKHPLTQEAFEVDSTAAGLLRLFMLPSMREEEQWVLSPLARYRKVPHYFPSPPPIGEGIKNYRVYVMKPSDLNGE